ncbi:YrzQ family protein [Rossellomorea sp. BNER]
MNKTFASIIGFGAGIATSVYSNRSNMFSKRNWKKLRKQMRKAF